LINTKDLQFLSKALHIVLKNGCFSFKDRYFLQTKGVAMGTNLGSAFANAYVFLKEKPFLDKWKNHIFFYRRYIDDIFMLVSRCHSNQIVNDLKNIDPDNLQFTVEQDPNELDFMDIVVYKGQRFHSNGILDIKPFHKPTNTFQYIHYSSAHTIHMKKAFIKGELIRLVRNSSCQLEFHLARNFFFSNLLKRGYALEFISQVAQDVKYSDRPTYLIKSDNTDLTEQVPSLFMKTTTSDFYNHFNVKSLLLQHWQPEFDTFTSKPRISVTTEPSIGNKLK
jgi:hypothetical protein